MCNMVPELLCVLLGWSTGGGRQGGRDGLQGPNPRARSTGTDTGNHTRCERRTYTGSGLKSLMLFLLREFGCGRPAAPLPPRAAFPSLSALARGWMPHAGTNIGGGTFWGLCRLLTGLSNFDEILELSSTGDNSNVREPLAAITGNPS